MKTKFILFIGVALLVFGCGSKSNSPEFIEQVSGRYLINSDEVMEVYFENEELLLKWRGANNIVPLALGDEAFFVKEMNEKITFRTNPKDNMRYMCKIPKDKDSILKYDYRSISSDHKTPTEFLNAGEYDKAKLAILAIKQKDSTDFFVEQNFLNRYGYDMLRDKKYEISIALFEVNATMYPESSNVYDSLGEAFMKSGDTAKAITNYSRSLELDSGNRSAERQLKKLRKEEDD